MNNFTRAILKNLSVFALSIIAISASAQPPAPTVSGTQYICYGTSTALTAVGTLGATFAWYSDAGGENLITTSATYTTPTLTSTTNYYVLQTVSGVSSGLYTVVVTVNNLPSVSAGNNLITCPGSGVMLTASGADTYSWQPGGSTNTTISVIPATTTTYTVTGTTAATGCSNTSQVTVTVSSVSTSSQAICAGQSAGISASGSANNYTWQPGNLSGPSVTVTPTNTTIYTITGQDANGCITTANDTVTVNSLPNISAGSPVIISGGTSTTLAATGGDNYAWSNSANTVSTTVMPAVTTTYTVTGTVAATGCSNTASVTVTVVTIPFITGNLYVCSGSTTSLTASGLAGATFAWYSDAGGSNLLSSSASYTTPSLTSATNYYVQQTYNGVIGPMYNAEVFDTPIPSQSTPTNLLATPATICQGQSSILTATVDSASGQYLYWYDSLGNLLAGSASGGNFAVSPTGTTTYYAQSQALIDTATFNFTGGVQTFTVPAGVTSIQVDVRGARGGDDYDCSYSGTVQGSPGLGGRVQATLNVTPGEVLNIFVGQQGMAGYICTGYYSGYNGGGSIHTDDIYSEQGGGGGATDIRINGQSLENRVVVAGGGGGTGAVPGGGGGGLTGGNGGSGTNTESGPINNNGGRGGTQSAGGAGASWIGMTSGSGTLGQGGNTFGDGQTEDYGGGGGGGGYYGGGAGIGDGGGGGGSSYTDPVLCQNVVHNQGYQNGAGQLIITYITAANCASPTRQPVTVAVDTTPTVSAGPNVTTCVGTGVTLTGTGTDSYSWQPGSLTGASVFVTPTATTTYTVTGTKANGGCTNTSQVTVTVTSTSASAPQTICVGQSATLNASGASTYTWQPGNLTGSSVSVSPSDTTIYTVIGSNPSGCNTTANDTVYVNQLPVVSAGSGVSVSAGSSVTLTATGADNYNWPYPYNYNGSSITFTPSATSTWQVTGTLAATGCSNTASAVVTVTPVAAITGNTVICPGGNTTLTASGNAPFTWYSSNTSSTVLYTGATFTTPAINADTTYWVSDNSGTRVPVSIALAQTSYKAAATPTNICPGGTSGLTVNGYNQTLNWYDAGSGGNLLGTATGGSAFNVTTAATAVYYTQVQDITQPDTATFNFTGGVQTFTVPAGVTSIQVDVRGARGGDDYDCSYSGTVQGSPGLGGRVQATLNVTPGEVLNIFVGQQGMAGYICTGYYSGYNGGGSIHTDDIYSEQGGGGGATDIRINGQSLENRVVVAGGGGGTGAVPGGGGGGLTGGNGGSGTNTESGPINNNGGRGGTQSAGGAGASWIGMTSGSGTLGQGGNTFGDGQTEDYGGGGGGGGYYGGGAGIGDGGGGGGSSYTDPVLCQNVVHNQGYQNGAGQLIITYNTAHACNTIFTVSDTVVVSKTSASAVTAICVGGTDTLTATGAASYTWQPGNLTGPSIVVSPADTTIYTVTGYNTVANCNTMAYDTVFVKPLPVLSITPVDTTIVINSPVLLSATGANVYAWSPVASANDTVTVTPLTSTTYIVTGSSSITGCSNTASASVTVIPIAPVVTGNLAVCYGTNTTLNANGTAPFNWYSSATGGSSIYTGASYTTPAITGNVSYWVDGGGSFRTQVNITSVSLPVVTATPVDTAIGLNNPVLLSAAGADTYTWSPVSSTNDTVTVTPSDTTTYTVTGTSAATGCSNTAQAVVNVVPAPGVTGLTSVCPGSSTTLAASGTAPFNWYTSATGGTPVYTGASFTTPAINVNSSYWVAGNASDRVQVNITVNPDTVSAVPAICAGSSAALIITGAIQPINWYDAATGGNLLGSVTGSAPFNVTPDSTTIYYAQTQYYLANGQTASQTFGFWAGGVQQFTVPAGVTSIQVDASGARGGYYNQKYSYGTPGLGGRVQATMQVTPGEVLYLYVGDHGYGDFNNGYPGNNTAYNGGGYVDNTDYNVGGGGGATDIRIGGQALSNRVLVAGGGGGAGQNGTGSQYGTGGAGGGLTGGLAGLSLFYDYGGGGGTQGGGGAAGNYNIGSFLYSNDKYGNAGTLGVGGAGANDYSSSNTNGYWGAGGGGGYYGGGGATEYGGGGGGSSYTNSLFTSVTHTQGYNNGAGQITITYNALNTCNLTLPDTVIVNPGWTGAVDSNWNNAANWCSGTVPTATSNVVIGAGTPHNPVISNGGDSVNSITVVASASLTVTNGDTLAILGNANNGGTFNASAGGLSFIGSAPQAINGVITTNNLIINNGTGVTITGGTTTVLGIYTPVSGTLTADGYLVLASTPTGTANVAPGSGNYVSGNVVVERYIPAHRAWRFLTAPLSSEASIFNTWQNGGNVTDSTGVAIWSPNGNISSNGMTQGGNAPSMEYFDPTVNNGSGGAWVGLTSTYTTVLDGSTASAANKAFGVFVTGPFGSGRITPAQGDTSTTLLATGQLQTGQQVFNYSNIPAGNYILVGNPYAAPVDFTHVGATGAASGNLNNIMWAWDAQRSGTSYGGYVTFSWDAVAGSYDQDIDPGQTAQTDTIQSGQAIFVQADTVNHINGSLENVAITFNESDKAIGKNTNQVFGVTLPASQVRIALNRQDGTTMQPVDGVLIKYGSTYKAGVSDDASKLYNYDENFALRIGNNYLAIERRPTPVTTDTLFLDIYALKKNTSYSFTINPQNINLGEGIQPYLVDNYLNTKIPISFAGNNTVAFNTTNTAASYGETRFVIVFSQTQALATTLTNVKAWAKDKGVQVQWTVATEQGINEYIVEKSADGITFTSTDTTAAINNNQTQVYDWFDANPYNGNNYYRIKVINKDGSSYYSNVVMVNVNIPMVFKAYPNPLQHGEQLRVEISGMPVGKYTLQIFSNDGKQVMQKILTSDGNTSTELINLPTVAAGVYQVILFDEKGKEWKQKLMIN